MLSCTHVDRMGQFVDVLRSLGEWLDGLRNNKAVSVGLFDMVAEDHGVDIYVLQPSRNTETHESFLHAVRFSAGEGVFPETPLALSR